MRVGTQEHSDGAKLSHQPGMPPLFRISCTKEIAFYRVYIILTLDVCFLQSDLILTNTEAIARLGWGGSCPSRTSGDHRTWRAAMNAFNTLLASQVDSPQGCFLGARPTRQVLFLWDRDYVSVFHLQVLGSPIQNSLSSKDTVFNHLT